MMIFKLVSRSTARSTEPVRPWQWTVHFYRDEDVIEFAGGYFEAGTYYGPVRKWGAVVPSETGWTHAEWSPASQSWVPRRSAYFVPYVGGADRG